MNSWLTLEFLKVILSWPVLIGIGFIFLIRMPEIKALIGRIDSAEFPGWKIKTQQEKLKLEPTTVSVQPDTNLKPENIITDETKFQEIKQLFEVEQITARIWEYRYLNYFFVDSTQAVLNWLISLDTIVTFSMYDTLWMPAISLASERQSIIEALQRHYLIICSENTISVTPKGKEYAQWPERRKFNSTA